MRMKELSIAALSELTASNTPAPGGGSISALAGAFGAALTCMAARLTVGKKGYEDVQGDLDEIIKKADTCREELLDSITKDAEAYETVMAAFSMPKSTDEEKALRKDAIQEAFKEAAAVPLATAEKVAKIMDIAEDIVIRGNKNAMTDALVGVMLCNAAVRGSVLNVLINLESIEDEAFVSEMRARCETLNNKEKRQESSVS